MDAMIFASIVLFAVTSAPGTVDASVDSLPQRLLSTAFFPLRHPQVGQSDWLAARDFTERYLRALGLNVTRQLFQTSVLFDEEYPQTVEGVNLLTVLPGPHWWTDSGEQDDIVVIAAHYDTDVTDMGVRPGSGMVALLEVARHLQERSTNDHTTLRHTVILAAFDLMTSEHSWGKVGDSGAEVFIRDFLNPVLRARDSRRFQGALVLDSVFNFNSSLGSQVYPEGFNRTFPGVSMDSRGNFLGVVGRTGSESMLETKLASAWSQGGSGGSRLEPLRLPQPPPETDALFQFISQPHAAFWNRVSGGVVSPLPAVLLTDTGRYRQLPRRCLTVNTICGPQDILTAERMRFFNKTVAAVTEAVVQMQGSASYLLLSWVAITAGLLASFTVQ